MAMRKGLFYKSMILAVAILMVFALTGCGGNESSSDNSSSTSSNNNESKSNVEDTNGSSDSIGVSSDFEATDYDEMLDSGVSPVSVGITKYLEVKGVAYEMLTPVMDQISETNPFAALAFLPLFTVDLTIMPLTMLAAIPEKGNGVWEGNLMLLYNGTGRVEAKGDINTFSMNITNDDSEMGSMTIEGEYDAKTDSMQAVFKMGDGTQMVFEYVASDDGYVSQLYTEGEEENTLIKNAVNNTKLYAGLIDESSKPDSIYKKKVTDWESFVANDTLMIVIDNGKGYSILDGEKFEH